MIAIAYLADHLETIATLAKWFRAQWPAYYARQSQAEMEQGFHSEARRAGLPLRLVAFVSAELAGTVVLRERALANLAAFQPGLGGLYVVERQRGGGVGSALVRAGMETARQQGYEALYATTVAAAGILERLGWERITSVHHQGEQLAVYRCSLNGQPPSGRPGTPA